jgi:hypothetical protein
MPARRAHLFVALALAAGMIVAGCAKTDNGLAPTVGPTVSLQEVTTTTVVDLSGIRLTRVPGETTTTVAIGPGQATLNGTVTGPQGPVGGATVHVERLVGDGVATQDIVSNADGTFNLPNILGGRYRVRAYVPDPYNLAQVTPDIVFLDGTETQSVQLEMGLYSGMSVKRSMAPSTPVTDTPANLVVQVTNQTVDAQGIVRGTALPGAKVELFGSAAWAVETDNPGTTDGAGSASFRIQCGAPGPQPLSVVVDDTTTVDLKIPDCVTPPPTTTTTLPPPTLPVPVTPTPSTSAAVTTTTVRATTTTTRPATTTTTTRR